MIKVISIGSVKPGKTVEEAYELWRDKHQAYAKKYLLPELRKYKFDKIIRSVRVITDKGGLGEEINVGIPELYFDDIESAQRAFARMNANPPDEFLSSMKIHARLIVEEEEIPLP